MPAQQAKSTAKKPGALVRKAKLRSKRFDTDGAKCADVAGMPGLKVTRGYRTGADRVNTDEYLVLIDGTRETGIPLPAVGEAIVERVITDAEVSEAQAAR